MGEPRDRRGHDEERMATQRAVKPALRRRLVVEVELVEDPFAELTHDCAGIDRWERDASGATSPRAARGPGGPTREPRPEHLDRYGGAVELAAVDLGAGSDRDGIGLERVELVRRLAPPRRAQRPLDLFERNGSHGSRRAASSRPRSCPPTDAGSTGSIERAVRASSTRPLGALARAAVRPGPARRFAERLVRHRPGS